MEILLRDFHLNLQEEQKNIIKTLEEMKTDGKEKNVRYREMFGQKLVNKAMLEAIERYTAKRER